MSLSTQQNGQNDLALSAHPSLPGCHLRHLLTAFIVLFSIWGNKRPNNNFKRGGAVLTAWPNVTCLASPSVSLQPLLPSLPFYTHRLLNTGITHM